MAFELVIAEGNERGRKFRFDGREVTIGRAPENDLVVHDPRASRGHARIHARGDGAYALIDDGSCNGTELNDRATLGAARLRTGDRIRVGSTVLEFAARREPLDAVRARKLFGRGIAAVCRWPMRIRVGLLGAGATSLAMCIVLVAAMVENGAAAAASRQAIAMDAVGGTAAAAPDVPPAAEMLPETVGLVRGIREPYERGRRKLEERRIAPRNLYDAWRAFAAAANAVDATPRDAAIQLNLSRLVRWTERELETECRRLLFGAARSERYGQEAQAQATYREILLHFPGEDPSGCRRKAQDALTSFETADPAGGVFGYPEPR
jgi:Inner membrane component of T3SS, cytoplasmic domain